MEMLDDEAKFSRSGRSGAGGKGINRVTSDVSDGLLLDISEALERFREQAPTMTRAELLRNLIDEDLNGCIVGLLRTFPAADSMTLEAAESAMAALQGLSVEAYRKQVMAQHIFGRLSLDSRMGHDDGNEQHLNGSDNGTLRMTRAA